MILRLSLYEPKLGQAHEWDVGVVNLEDETQPLELRFPTPEQPRILYDRFAVKGLLSGAYTVTHLQYGGCWYYVRLAMR